MNTIYLKTIIPILTLTTSAQAQFSIPDIANNEMQTLHEESYVFITHGTSIWDWSGTTRRGINRLIKFAHKTNIPVIAAVHSEAFSQESQSSLYYFKPESVDVLLESQSGQHKIKFPNLKKIYFGGGNITYCLCESIRDIVRGIDKYDDVELIFVRDAIYDSEPSYAPMEKTA